MPSPLHLHVEGWRDSPHSYAVVNQFQCLALLQRGDIRLTHGDWPLPHAHWSTGAIELFSDDDRGLIGGIPSLADDTVPDCWYRIGAPFDLRPSRAPLTLIFLTEEFASCQPHPHAPYSDLHHLSPSVHLVTPSQWARRALLAGGAPETQLHCVPHGIDPKYFFPIDADHRTALRQQIGWNDRFVFFNNGAMTLNKGVPTLLRAFAEISARHPDALLVLKGLNSLYQSETQLGRALAECQLSERVRSQIQFVGGTLRFDDVALLYQLADCYVSPYHAEGFNLPVLEALACGLPAICTAHGPTDDFADPRFALRIDSCPGLIGPTGQQRPGLIPSLDHLIILMEQAMRNDGWRETVHREAPAIVQEHWSYTRVVDQYLRLIDRLRNR